MNSEEHGKRVARDTLIVRLFIVISTAILGAILFVSVNTAADTNHVVSGIEKQQDATTRTVNTAIQTLNLVRDCTEPGGKCFGDGQKRTSEAVGDIGRLSIYAAACAADPQLIEETLERRAHLIERCVTRLVEERG